MKLQGCSAQTMCDTSRILSKSRDDMVRYLVESLSNFESLFALLSARSLLKLATCFEEERTKCRNDGYWLLYFPDHTIISFIRKGNL